MKNWSILEDLRRCFVVHILVLKKINPLNQQYFLRNIRFNSDYIVFLKKQNKQNKQKIFDPDVIRTRSLLSGSPTRYHCATESVRHLKTISIIKLAGPNFSFLSITAKC